MKTCHACGHAVDPKASIARRDECPSCHADLHSCMNCSLHDSKVSRECREPVAEPVKDKKRANFCDYFTFRQREQAARENTADKARKQLDDLFRQ